MPSTTSTTSRRCPAPDDLLDWPILYEDEEEGDMGETSQHTDTDAILYYSLNAHFAHRSEYHVFSNLNLYYRKGPRHPKTRSLPYVSPDDMVVRPWRPLGDNVRSYTVGKDGPNPDLTAEILSLRSAQQQDLKKKVTLYARLKVPEYLLIDATGKYLKERLLLKTLRADGTWLDCQDTDGGITSKLGFRVIIDHDDRLRVLDAATLMPYARPDEAQTAVDGERRAMELLQKLQVDNERLRAKLESDATEKKRRRKK